MGYFPNATGKLLLVIFSSECPEIIEIRTRNNLESAREMSVSRNYSIENFLYGNSADYLAKLINPEAKGTVTYKVPIG
jgi:hypothetical protein